MPFLNIMNLYHIAGNIQKFTQVPLHQFLAFKTSLLKLLLSGKSVRACLCEFVGPSMIWTWYYWLESSIYIAYKWQL